MQKLNKVKSHFDAQLAGKHLRDLIASKTTIQDLLMNEHFAVDLSRQKIDKEIVSLFQEIFDNELKSSIQAMYHGEKINTTEKREVLHHLLRRMDNKAPSENLQTLLDEIKSALDKVRSFVDSVRSGEIRSSLGHKFENIISIGIGGSYLGVEAACEAFKLNPRYSHKENLNLYFLSNVDPASFHYLSSTLDASKTLVIIISKSFTTAETVQNAKLTLEWMMDSHKDKGVDHQKIIADHFCAVSANIPKCQEFGIVKERVFEMWDSIGGRFSVSSCVGAVPLSLAFSFKAFEEMLQGMNFVDDMFFEESNITKNIPVLLGLVDAFQNYIQGFNTKAIIPYSQGLSRLPSHIQQVDMESNGKNYNAKNNTLLGADNYIAKFVFGEPGTNSQHSFFQSLHQGRPAPIDFIGFSKSQVKTYIVDGKDCYNEFMANLFAQADALAIGQENKTELFRHFEGDRPSTIILFKESLNAFNLGCLLALYEHRIAVEGFLADINSFDQYGVELGKKLATNISSSLKTEGKPMPESTSVSAIVDYYNHQR